MMCEECGVNPAVFHFVTIRNDERTERNLCPACMAKYKKQVEVVPVDYKYSFGNQSDAKTHRNSVQEYLFVGY